jgi:hypothetical protein
LAAKPAALLRWIALGTAVASMVWPGLPAVADEGGVSFWLPGEYASFAAIAPDPGFSLPLVSYVFWGSAEKNKTFQRGPTLNLGLNSQFFGEFIVPTYTADTTILGARPSVSLALVPAYNNTTASAQVGRLSAARSSSVGGFSDLYPTAQLFWDRAANNAMAYFTGDIPVGSYEANRLSNLGIGHGAIDGGGAYTYLNTNTGSEVSATLGFTYNFENNSTHVTNGIDSHIDMGAAQFLNEHFFIGAVGYVYDQLTADRGQPAVLGSFKSFSEGAGPQIGYNFPVGGTSIYTNLRAYFEFNNVNRMGGDAVYLTINLPISGLAKR